MKDFTIVLIAVLIIVIIGVLGSEATKVLELKREAQEPRWIVNDSLGIACLVAHSGIACVPFYNIPAR